MGKVKNMQSLLQHRVIVRKLKNGATLLLEPLSAFSTASLAFLLNSVPEMKLKMKQVFLTL